MSRLVKPTISAVTKAVIRGALVPIERQLEGLIDSSNIYRDDQNVAEISSTVIADLAEPGRPITGNKFFGYSASRSQETIEASLYEPLIDMMKKNLVIFPLIGRTVFQLNPQNTEYTEEQLGTLVPGDQYARYHGTISKNSVRENKTIAIQHATNQRPVTVRRLMEIFNDLDCIDWGGKAKEVAISTMMFVPQNAGCAASLDMPIFSVNRFRDSNISTLRTKEHFADIHVELGGNKPDELWFNTRLELVGGVADDEFFTEIVEVRAMFEEIL